MRSARLVLGSVLLGLVLLALPSQGSDPETWPTVYQDDFEDPTSGWRTGETEYASRAYVNGSYEIQVKDDWSIAWSRIPGDREYLDFVAEGASAPPCLLDSVPGHRRLEVKRMRKFRSFGASRV